MICVWDWKERSGWGRKIEKCDLYVGLEGKMGEEMGGEVAQCRFSRWGERGLLRGWGRGGSALQIKQGKGKGDTA